MHDIFKFKERNLITRFWPKTGKSRTRRNTGKNQKQGRRESDLSWCMKYREKTKTGMTRTRPFLVHEIQGKSKNREIQNQNFLSA